MPVRPALPAFICGLYVSARDPLRLCARSSAPLRESLRISARDLTRRFEQQKPKRRERQTKRLIVAMRGDRFGEDRAAVSYIRPTVDLTVAVDELEVGTG